jgi:hypothetical protein
MPPSSASVFMFAVASSTESVMVSSRALRVRSKARSFSLGGSEKSTTILRKLTVCSSAGQCEVPWAWGHRAGLASALARPWPGRRSARRASSGLHGATVYYAAMRPAEVIGLR